MVAGLDGHVSRSGAPAAAGLDPESEQARRAVGLVHEQVVWRGGAPVETPWASNRFFDGEVEPCINGNVVSTGS